MTSDQHPAITAVELERANVILEFINDPHNQDGSHIHIMRGYLDGEVVAALTLVDCATGDLSVAAIFVDAALAKRFTSPLGALLPYTDPIVIDPTLN